MRPGSKGWILFIQKLYCFSEALLLLAIVAKFLLWHMPELKSPLMVSMINVSLMAGVFNLAIIHVFAMFAPVQQRPNWALVYPKLKRKN
jgi:hypothetical protein